MKLKNEKGFMGPTHALSGLAIFLFLVAVAPSFIHGKILKTDNPIVVILACIVVIGGSLSPDMDSPQSTANSTLGFFGVIMSNLMKWTSLFFQNTFKSKSDGSVSNPHRGFWHTIISAFIIGLLTTLVTMSTYEIKLGVKTVTTGMIATVFIVYSSVKLTLAIFAKKEYNRIAKGGLGVRLAYSFIALILSVGVILLIPDDISYAWVGGALALGWFIHIMGDTFTVAGVPVLWPIKIKGKRWWNIRMPLTIKAGGALETAVFIPVFLLISIISTIIIIWR